jgi:hypothetical protein
MIYVSRMVPGEWLQAHINQVLSSNIKKHVDICPIIFQLHGHHGPHIRTDDMYRVVWKVDLEEMVITSAFDCPYYFGHYVHVWPKM